jgi:hypothetical protein
MTIQYHPEDFNELTVLLRWKGTILPAVLCKPAIWLLLFVHFSCCNKLCRANDARIPHDALAHRARKTHTAMMV